eukprot:c43236_g1_i1 orf=99-293(-)
MFSANLSSLGFLGSTMPCELPVHHSEFPTTYNASGMKMCETSRLAILLQAHVGKCIYTHAHIIL